MRTSATRAGLLAALVVAGAVSTSPGAAAAGSATPLLGAGVQAPGARTEPVGAQGETRVEYIAHAAFIIESPGGTRIAIDPYNGNTWLGYSFPEGLEADAVLVSHPHFDHDATYYFSDLTPVFRSPGEYRLGDVAFRGLETEHVGSARFLERGQAAINTVWVVESGGLRIAHLGDSRLLNEVDLEALGSVDVLLVGAAYFDAPNAEMLALLLAIARPQVLIPMHYRHHEITELPSGMRPVAEYLQNHDPLYVDSSVASFSPQSLSDWPQVVVLKPSPAVEPWSDALSDAWVEANEGAGMLADSETEGDPGRAEENLWEGLFHFEAAMDLAPTVLHFGYGAGDALARLGHANDAIETLDHALARAPRADWTERSRTHMLLGELYEAAERLDIAFEHYAYVAAQQHTHETKLRERAVARLAEGHSR